MTTARTSRAAGATTLRYPLVCLAAAIGAFFVLGAPLASAAEACPNEQLRAETGSLSLPDCRAYELVSTSGAFGEPYEPASYIGQQGGLQATEHPFEAAEDGERVTYVGEPPQAGGTGELGGGQGDQWLATRTPSGWQTIGITPPLNGSVIGGQFYAEPQPFQAFSSDLSSQIFQGARTPLTAGLPQGCHGLYARTDDGSYRPLFEVATAEGCRHPLFAGASSDEKHVIFQTQAALIEPALTAEEAPPTREHTEVGFPYGEGCMFGCNLYEATEGRLQLVNVIEGTPVPNAMFGGYPGKDGSGFADFSNAISADGSRIFWTDTEPGPDFEHVYAREEGIGTVEVSGGAAQYWTATPDGHYAYYTEAGRLWRFDTSDNTPEPLTPAGAEVNGAIGTNQTGEDGSYIYFVAGGAIASGATQQTCQSYSTQEERVNQREEEGLLTPAEANVIRVRLREEAEKEVNGETPPDTGCNLYVLHGGATTLIATLSFSDNEILTRQEKTGGDWKPGLGERTAELTPDGRHLVFESSRPLTGYQNRIGRQSQNEVFVYDAASPSLLCASCDPVGSPPTVLEIEKLQGRLPVSAVSDTYMHRWVSGDGDRVFFDSFQPLVAQDVNEVQDVYEWEREGTSGCPTATSRFGGCLSLISGGAGQELNFAGMELGDSFLVDADATGDNVFFEQHPPLGKIETKAGVNQLYDARVGGGFPIAGEVPCESGDACGGAATGQGAHRSPGSESFSEPARPGACPKGHVRRKGRCVRKHKRGNAKKHRHHARKHHGRSAHNHRRAGK
jgi:hypothetical protein